MPLIKLDIKPGVNRETTNYANEGGYFVSDKVRFRGGFAQKIGGWRNISSIGSSFKGVAKALWNYVTLISQNLLAVGTNQKFYIELGGEYKDITPARRSVTLGADPISTTNGSRLVEISDTAHGALVGSYIEISNATAVGGITMSGSFEIIKVIDADTIAVVADSAASSTDTGGGSSVDVVYDINAGPAVATDGIGWGGPPWGAGGWGSNSAVGLPQRLWSATNFGDDLLFAQRFGAVYYWTADTTNFPRAITLNEKADSIPKFATVATFASGAVTITVPDVSSVETGMVVSGSGIPDDTFVTTAWTGGTSVNISNPTTESGSSTPVTFSFAGRHVPNRTLLVIYSPVSSFFICMGANPYNPGNFDEPFDPLLVRWSDQENPFEWVPSVTNQSGEQRLSNGSKIMAAANTRQEILILTDAAVFSMQYIGPPFVWNISLMDENISVASQNAVVSVNNAVYWMGIDKFYVYNGRVQTLPSTLRQHVFSTLNRDQIDQVVAGHNERFSEIWWIYPGTGSSLNSLYVVYNYLEDIWHYGSLSRSAFAPNSLRRFPMMSFSVQNSYLVSAINATDTEIPLLSAITYPDSGVVDIGGEKIIYEGKDGNALKNCVRGAEGTVAASHGAFTPVVLATPNQVLFHEFGWDDLSRENPQPIKAFIETSDFDIGDGDRFSFVSRIIPDVKFLGSTVASPSIDLTVFPHDFPGSAYGQGNENNVRASVVLPVEQYTEQVFTRIRGRQIGYRISSDELGVAWQAGAMRLDIRPDGRR